MGTFDEAKKYFPTPQPELGPPKPKDKPQPLGLGRPMQFNGVVGRSSLPIATTLTNPNNRPVAYQVKTSGTEFRATSTAGEIEKVQGGDNTTNVSVEYVPTKPGTTHGLLHIMSTFDDKAAGERGPAVEQDLELIGTATELEHPKPAPADGSPRPIPDLGADNKQVASRQQIKTDLDALSGLAETYKQVVGAGDVANGEMFERIYSAKFEFETEIRQWVEAELASNKISDESSTAKLAWKAMGKALGAGIDKLEMSSVVSLAVGVVAEMAFDRLEEYVGKDPHAKSKAAAGAAASEGAAALIATTDADVKRRMSGLNTRLVQTRATAAHLAGAMAMDRERVAQEALVKDRPYEHPSTATLMIQFREALDGYSDTCRAIAATATQFQPKLAASFNELRMNYLKVRASNSSDLAYRVDYTGAWDLGTDDSHGRETFRMFEPRIGSVDRFSEPMRKFITHRKLSDYAADADVSVRVDCKQGGYVIIERKVGGEPTFKDVAGTAAVRAAMRGARDFWRVLEEQIG